MGLSDWFSLGILLTGVILAWDCILRWSERKVVEGSENPTNLRRRFMAVPLGIGAFIGIGFAAWLFFGHPFSPQIGAGPQPCPVTQQQTGDATTKGNQSPANSGNANPTNYGTPPPPAAKPPAAKP
jgi:hypothetical protein